MSTANVGIQFVADRGETLLVDDVSVTRLGVEHVANGGFESEAEWGDAPDGWDGGATRALGLSGLSSAEVTDELHQIVSIEAAEPHFISCAIKGKGSLFVFHTVSNFGVTSTPYLTVDGWSATPQPLYRVDAESRDWSVFAALEFSPLQGIQYMPPTPLAPATPTVSLTETEFVPGGEGATLAIAGLAVSGLSRAGFYPKQTDDIVAPPADPPVFDGGIYAYHKDEEGKE